MSIPKPLYVVDTGVKCICLYSYYRGQQIVCILNDFHCPPAFAEAASRRQARPKKIGARSRHGGQGGGLFIENREMPILHKSQAVGQETPR